MVEQTRDPVNTITIETPHEGGTPSRRGFFERIAGTNSLFLITVVVPTLLAIVYFGLIASDVYLSESHFIVTTPDRQAASSPLTMLMSKNPGFARANNDTYTVQNFILSRDVLKLLEEKFNLVKTYSHPKIDILNRYTGWDWWNNSFEDFHRYYQSKIVTLELDTISSIAALTVRAFSAEDAFRINQQLLEMSEALINQLNERGRQDQVRFAANEVASAEKIAKAADLALSSYRNQKGVINPEQQSSIHLQQIAKLQDELIATQVQLRQLQTFTTSNPLIPSLQQRAKDLRQEIEVETNRVAGGDRSLAEKAAEYQRLALDRDYADKQLASALASLEQARNEAQRKQLYLERIVQPSKPDKAMEPRRLRGILAVFLSSLVVFGICAILFAGIREHRS